MNLKIKIGIEKIKTRKKFAPIEKIFKNKKLYFRKNKHKKIFYFMFFLLYL